MHVTLCAVRTLVPGDVVLIANLFYRRGEDFILNV